MMLYLTLTQGNLVRPLYLRMIADGACGGSNEIEAATKSKITMVEAQLLTNTALR